MRRHASLRAAAALVAVVSVAPAARGDDAGAWLAGDTHLALADSGGALPSKLRINPEARFLTTTPPLESLRLRVGPFWDWSALRLAAQGLAVAGNAKGRYENELRLELEPTIRGTLGDAQLSSRNRFELRSVDGDIRWRYRNRVRARYQPNDWFVWPYLANEVFVSTTTGFDENRAEAGGSVRVHDQARVDVSYLVRSERVEASWHQTHVITLTLLITTNDDRERD